MKEKNNEIYTYLTYTTYLEGWWMSKMDESVQNIQVSSCKINMFWGCNVLHSEYSKQYFSVYLRLQRE